MEGHRVDAGEIEGKVREHEDRGVVRGGVRTKPLRMQIEAREVHASAQGPPWNSGHMRHVRVMSPPWIMNPGMMRWKREVLVACSVHTTHTAHTHQHTYTTHTSFPTRNTLVVKCMRTDVAVKTGNRSSQTHVPDHDRLKPATSPVRRIRNGVSGQPGAGKRKVILT